MSRFLAFVSIVGLGLTLAAAPASGAGPRRAHVATGNQVTVAPTTLTADEAVPAFGTRALQVAGRGSAPSRGISSATVELSMARPAVSGVLVAYADGTRTPGVRTVSFTARRATASLALVRVGHDGRIRLANRSARTAHVRVVLLAYTTAAHAHTGGSLVPIAPRRIADTGRVLLPGHSRRITVAGRYHVPNTVRAVAVDVTVLAPRVAGYVTLYPAGRVRPTIHSITFAAHRDATALLLVPVGPTGQLDIFDGARDSARTLVDVVGYVRGGGRASVGSFVPEAPQRLLPGTVRVPAHAEHVVPVTGHAGVPGDGVAAALLAVTTPAPASAVRLGARADQTPTAPTVLATPARTTATASVFARVGADGNVVLTNTTAHTVRVSVFLIGYLTGPAAADVLAPEPVTGLTAALTTTTVSLTWTNPAGTDLHDIVVRRATGSRPPASPQAGTAVADVTRSHHSVKDSGLTRNATYSYAVFARDDAGNTDRPATLTTRLASSQGVSGTVTAADGGQPIAGVKVTATPEVTGTPTRSTTTADDGTYLLHDLAADTDYSMCFDASALQTGPTTGYAQQCDGNESVFVPSRGTRAGVDAALDVGGEIDGMVTDASGAPLRGVTVKIGHDAGDTFPTDVRTDSSGHYAVRGLPAGRYGLCFDPAAASGGSSTHGYAPQCVGGTPFEAYDVLSTVPAAVGQVTPGVDVALEAFPTVSGTVLGSGGHGLAGVVVAIVTNTDLGDVTFSTRSGADGTYSLRWDGNPNDQICFTPPADVPYAERCYYNLPGMLTTPGVWTDANEVFAPPAGSAVVVGRVTDPTGRPLSGVAVMSSNDLSQARAVTGTDGRYRLAGLAGVQGDTFCFTPGAATSPRAAAGYVPTSVDGIDDTTAPQTTVNATIGLGGAISGVVTDKTGKPLAGLLVKVGSSSGAGGYPTTDSHGRYSLTALEPGTYYVAYEADGAYGNDQSYSFYHGGTSPTGYLDQCWKNISPYSECTGVAVTAGKTTTGIDAHLAPAGGLSGTVTDTAGHPLRHVNVSIFGGIDDVEQTDLNGHYIGILLPPGAYKICFAAQFGTTPAIPSGYAERCYRDSADWTTATEVPVSSGHVAAGIDVRLPAAPVGSMTGTVTDPNAQPVAHVNVYVGGSTATTDADGIYRVDNLPAGDYTVCFEAKDLTAPSPTGYVDSCRNDDVTVTAGQTATADGQLQSAAIIAGVVTDEQHTPLRDVDISVYRNGQDVHDVRTDATGHYRITGLAASSYPLYFGPDVLTGKGSGGFGIAGQWSGGSSDQSSADAVPATGGTITDYDVELQSDGAVSGAVTDESGDALPLVTVQLTSGDGTFHPATTGADGTYSIVGLAPGTYTECLTGNTSSVAPYGVEPDCYGDSGSGAASIPVTAGHDTAAVNSSLTRFGAVQVTVSDATSHPLEDAIVQAHHANGDPTDFYLFTDENGSATLAGMEPGDYVLDIRGSAAGYPGGDGNGYGDAEVPVQVSPGVQTSAAVVLSGN